MIDSDKARPEAETSGNEAQVPSREAAHMTSFTAEVTPQASIEAPEPFTELENLYAENSSLKDKVLRTLAEMENLRRRTEREVAEAKVYGIRAFARDMLSFADNLRRAIDSLPPEVRASAAGPLKTLIEGIELTERDFQTRLARHGVRKLEPLGQKFDPNVHEALFEVPDASVPSGTVVQVVEAGYVIGERVLRPAKVGVARGGPKTAAPENRDDQGA